MRTKIQGYKNFDKMTTGFFLNAAKKKTISFQRTIHKKNLKPFIVKQHMLSHLPRLSATRAVHAPDLVAAGNGLHTSCLDCNKSGA